MSDAVLASSLFVLVGAVCYGLFMLHQKRERRRESLLNTIRGQAVSLGVLIQRNFLVQPCSSCRESLMRLIELSPNARSVQYECVYCGKKARAAGARNAQEAIPAWNRLLAFVQKLQEMSKRPVSFTLEFEAVRGLPPYEQTTREPIPPHVRGEVFQGPRELSREARRVIDRILLWLIGGAIAIFFLFGWKLFPPN